MVKPISARKMKEIIESMRTMFEPLVLEQGWHYYHRGRIRQLTTSGPDIRAVVTGSSPARIRLHLDALSSSECTCSSGPRCKHVASVCFQLYTAFGRPELLLQELKQQAIQRKKRSATMQAKYERALVSAKSTKLEHSPKAWQNYFEQQFYGYAVTSQHAVEDFYQIVLERQEQLAADWSDSDRSYLKLHVMLYILSKCNQFYAHNDTAYMSYYLEAGIRQVAKQVMEQLESIVPDIATTHKSQIPKNWLRETADSLRRLVGRAGRQISETWDAYRFIWFELLGDPQRILRETKRINEEWAHSADIVSGKIIENTDPDLRRRLTVLLAHFDVMAGEDEKAFARLGQWQQEEHAEPYLWYLHRFRQLQDWPRLHRWLRQLIPYMQHASQAQFRLVTGYWAELSTHLDTETEWAQVMIDLLPRSYTDYADYLIRSGKYKQWVDLQLSHRMLPAHLYNEELRQVEQHHVELLLPLYHQSVERYIMEKNRSSYIHAVRLLRKLRNYYHTLERTDCWQHFILQYANKHARLKAFHEELQKGKLIP